MRAHRCQRPAPPLRSVRRALILTALSVASLGAAPPARLMVVPVLLEAPGSVAEVQQGVRAALGPLHGIVTSTASVEELGRWVPLAADSRRLAEVLALRPVELGLVVLVNAATHPALLAIRLVAVPSGRVLASASGSAQLGAGELEQQVEEETRRLLEGQGYRRAARLLLRAEPAQARLTLDGVPVAAGEHRVAPGAHRLEAHAAGYRPQALAPVLAEGQQLEVPLELQPDEVPLLESPWLWIAVGAAALAVGTVALLAAPDRCLCVGPADKPCPGC